MKNLYFVTPVWGEAFIDRLFNVCLASMMSPGNLPRLVRDGAYNYSFVFYTLSQDIKCFEQHPAFSRLQQMMPVRFELLDDYVDHRPPLGRMSYTYHNVISTSPGEDNTFMFPIPDMVWSDGSFYNAVQIARSGKRAVLVSCFRTEEQSMLEALKPFRQSDGDVLSISSRELVATASGNLHPTAAAKIWSSEFFTIWPSYLLWPVSGSGFLQRSFQLLPILLQPINRTVLPKIWPDVTEALDGGEYLARAVPNPDDIYYVEDSDEFCGLDLVAIDGVKGELPDGHNYSNICETGLLLFERLQPICADIIRRRQFFHSQALDDSWIRAQAESDRVVDGIRRWAEFFAENPGRVDDLKGKIVLDLKQILKLAFRSQMNEEGWAALCAMLGLKP